MADMDWRKYLPLIPSLFMFTQNIEPEILHESETPIELEVPPSMMPMIDEPPGEPSNFVIQQHGHRDMVEAAAFNAYGNRMAIGCADGRMKVYDRQREGKWVLCDTWTAHNAEILEVKLSIFRMLVKSANTTRFTGSQQHCIQTLLRLLAAMVNGSCGPKIQPNLF
jgi:hypothetical protein